MNLQFTQEELDFQKEVKDWIKENYPSDMKERYVNSPNGHLTKEEHVQWQQALFSKGWAGINWPKEYGVLLSLLLKNTFLAKRWLQQELLASLHLESQWLLL